MKLSLFRKKDPLERLKKLRIKLDKKIAQVGRLAKKKGIRDTTREMLQEGINKLAEQRKKIIETIEKLENE